MKFKYGNNMVSGSATSDIYDGIRKEKETMEKEEWYNKYIKSV